MITTVSKFYFIYINYLFFKKESLFLFGKNENNQLGIENDKEGIDKISTITNDILKNFKIDITIIKKISLGWNHNLILIKGGLKLKKKIKKKKLKKKF
jgi:alpha-tubulin suppressor-like RCC1 family protein